MQLPREVLDRNERIREFHDSTKLPQQDAKASKDPAPPQPDPFRIFEDYPKTALPTNLISPSVPTVQLLLEGMKVLPDSQVQPPHDLRTLATWLYLSSGTIRQVRGRPSAWVRACPSEAMAYPCELYVAAFAIEGLEPGLYHFSVREFALRKLRDGWETLAQIKRGRPDLQFIKTSPAVLLVSTVICRSTWKLQQRGYRAALRDAGHLIQNISTVGAGLGIQTLVRLTVNAQNMRELIGIAPDADYVDAEFVQALVIWADAAATPLKAIEAYAYPTGGLPTIKRKPLAEKVVNYGSVMGAHGDCVAPGVAMRAVRPPLTELSPLGQDFQFQDFPEPDEVDEGQLLGRLILNHVPATEFSQSPITRNRLWTLNRLAFRWGSPYPLFPDGEHAALVRPFWIINNVSGVDAGIWYYYPQKDCWSCLRRGQFRQDAQNMTMGNPMFGPASAVCFMFANLHRLMNEGGPDLYRLAHIEAGTAGQRLYLATDAMGLGCALTGSFRDEDIRRFFGLDKTGWEPLYAVGLGVRPPRPAAGSSASEKTSTVKQEGIWLG
jgi:SagB-type dehydrogenase family enzyme